MNSTSPKPFVFVLMPFAPEFDDVYRLGIRSACEGAGAYCERVDEQMYEGTILNRIYNQIANANLIVADMTGRNPNVFYEVGYSHALGKKVILLTQKDDDIPFDLKHYPHIVYQGRIGELKDELQKRIAWAISQPGDHNAYFNSPIRCYIGANLLEGNPTLPLLTGKPEISRIDFPVNFHNTTDNSISAVDFQCGIVSPIQLSSLMVRGGKSLSKLASQRFRQSDGTLLHIIDNRFILLPGVWEKLTVTLSIASGTEAIKDNPICLAIRLFTIAGPRDYPFKVSYELNAKSSE